MSKHQVIEPLLRAAKGLALSLMFILSISSASATDLRGRIDGVNAYSPNPFPVRGAKVDLWYWNGAAWSLVYTYFTGFDGMYYIRNVIPGQYNIQINGMSYYPLTVYAAPLQDIPPISLRY
jgi:hypothetical protein